MDDKTFPNMNLVQGLLECMSDLNVNDLNIENSHILDVLEYYIDAKSLSPDIIKLVMSIKNKWERKLHGTTTYADGDQEHTEKFMRL